MKRFCLLKDFFYVFCLIAISLVFFSCVGTKGFIPEQQFIDRNIASFGIKSVEQLTNFFMSKNPTADVNQVKEMAMYYVEEASMEGINSDVAFVQMCLETGFLKFGGLVTPDMNNFCGLGAIDVNNPGERFESPRMGVRAHIQHLHAYGTTIPLKGELIDGRYKYVVPRGKAPDIYSLSGTWAADKAYGEKLEKLIIQLENF